MQRRWPSLYALALAPVATLSLLTSEVRAELEVMYSTAPNHKVGEKLPDGALLNIPAGSEVRLLKTPENATLVVKGPHTGSIADYGKRPVQDRREKEGATPGGVRGGSR